MAQIMYDHSCILGLIAFFLFWNNLSLFAYRERTCFTPIKWNNCLKYKVCNKLIYHTFSSQRGPLRCRLFVGDSVDTWGNIQSSCCIWLLVQFWVAVATLYSWKMCVSGGKTKNIHNSGKWIHFCNFLSCSTVLKLIIAKYTTRRKHPHCRYVSL